MTRRRRRRPSSLALKTSSIVTATELVGAGCIGVGLSLVYAPLGWIWAGVAILVFAYLLELKADQNADAGGRSRASEPVHESR